MAKATAEEAALTKQKIIDAAVSITLEQGFEEATLGNLAKYIGMSRSGITCHFRYKTDISEAIEPELSAILYASIDFSSCQSFEDSWMSATESNPKFRACIASMGPVIPSSVGFERLVKKIENGEHQQKRNTVYKCLGYSLVEIDRIWRA
ncbi:TetR family transcriptional regulator [Vibrio algarum]|uniref:TetR family transcriptional regulator n=1 Tax=Vibrio algarum TaxID=3020714 RepID=A0ABT4YXA5_9VIBR|nr:TetR family transcriptional regulator [Vibrio sp. KJ40-1]MDB1126214.1 TetR family transcriptional regulator [Vibrio sp. KJ40-1]